MPTTAKKTNDQELQLRQGDPIGIGPDEWARTEDEVRRIVEWASESGIRPSSLFAAGLADLVTRMGIAAPRMAASYAVDFLDHQILQIVCDAAAVGLARRTT